VVFLTKLGNVFNTDFSLITASGRSKVTMAESFHNELLSVIGFIICYYTWSPPQIIQSSSGFCSSPFYIICSSVLYSLAFVATTSCDSRRRRCIVTADDTPPRVQVRENHEPYVAACSAYR